MDKERQTLLQHLGKNLGYRFHDIVWLDKALTHRSFSNELETPEKTSYEVLEFIGDAVLNLAVSHLLLQEFPEAQEGTLSLKRSHLVKRSSLAFLAKELDLESYLLLGKGERINGGKGKSSILANACEAIFGAIFMDSGFDQASKVIREHFKPFLLGETAPLLFHDSKSLLQKYCQKAYALSPEYKCLMESGPDHDKRFQVSVTIHGEVKGVGWGKSKKEAEQEAAKQALIHIENQPAPS
jgi:ribonuclease III